MVVLAEVGIHGMIPINGPAEGSPLYWVPASMRSILDNWTIWCQTQEKINECDQSPQYESVIDPILLNMSYAELDCQGDSEDVVVPSGSNQHYFPSNRPNRIHKMKRQRKTGDDLALLEAERFSVSGQK